MYLPPLHIAVRRVRTWWTMHFLAVMAQHLAYRPEVEHKFRTILGEAPERGNGVIRFR
jgi:hypothetical protein